MIKKLMLLSALLFGAIQSAPATRAQDYPQKQPIKIVVSFSAGGLTDVLARITAEYLQRRLGQAVVVENRPGASGAIGLSYLANARPDGYTLYMSATEPAVLPAVRTDLPFASKDFTYLVRPFLLSPLLVVGPHVPVSTTQELIDYMKAHPGKLRYGTPGVGHLVHLGTALFESETGVEGVHVPYPGIAPIYTDLLAGNIDFTAGANLPFPDALKVLGPVGSKRSPAYPDLPILAEIGYPNAGFDVWFGLLAPPGLPQPIADRLILELESVFKDPEAIAKFQSAAKIVPDENPPSGADFEDAVVEESIRWRSVVEKEGITVQQ